MTIRDHVERAVEDELAFQPGTRPHLAEDMAFAAGSAALLVTCNTVWPVFGGLAAAASIPAFNRLRERTKSFDVPEHVERIVNTTCAVRQIPESAAWSAWVPWGDLCDGKEALIPPELPHPTEVGFGTTRLASNVGQAADWVRSLPDGSRLHVHEYADGRCVMHRDALDPAQGPATATLHWLSETKEGNMLFVLGTVGLLFATWRLVDS